MSGFSLTFANYFNDSQTLLALPCLQHFRYYLPGPKSKFHTRAIPMLLRVFLVFVVLLAAVLIFAATRPDTFTVSRSIIINAPPEKIFALIDDFHNWPRWASQDAEDPTMTRTYSGAENGVGAISDWTSKGSAGRGRMTIVESTPPSAVAVQVDFVKPFPAHNRNQFTLEPAGGATKVTWSMRGTNLYMMKVMSVFVSMDRIAGKHFESGLANLKTAAEK